MKPNDTMLLGCTMNNHELLDDRLYQGAANAVPVLGSRAANAVPVLGSHDGVRRALPDGLLGLGIADMIVSALQLEGLTESEARDRKPEYRPV
jgi:hypothetical protein